LLYRLGKKSFVIESCLGHSAFFNIALQPPPSTIGTSVAIALPPRRPDREYPASQLIRRLQYLKLAIYC
jgi:hypothetical protein